MYLAFIKSDLWPTDFNVDEFIKVYTNPTIYNT